MAILDRLTLLTLENSNFHISSSSIKITFGVRAWECCVFCNDFGHSYFVIISHDCNSNWNRNNILELNICNFLGPWKNSSLNSSSNCHCLVWMKLLVQSFTIKVCLQHFLNFWNARWASHKNYFINFTFGEIRIFDGSIKRQHTLFKERHAKFVEFCSREVIFEVYIIMDRINRQISLLRIC